MNALHAGTRTSRARRLGLACAALLAGTTLALSAPLASQASESSVPISFSFTNLVPGVPASQMIDLKIPRNGALDNFAWVERTGILKTATFAFEVCKTPTSCTPASTVERPLPVKAGTLAVRVTVTITEEGSGSAIGKLSLSSSANGILDDSVERPSDGSAAEPDDGSLGGLASILDASNGKLATTGVNALTIGLWGAAALALGAVALLWPRAMVLAARRKRDSEDDDNAEGKEGPR